MTLRHPQIPISEHPPQQVEQFVGEIIAGMSKLGLDQPTPQNTMIVITACISMIVAMLGLTPGHPLVVRFSTLIFQEFGNQVGDEVMRQITESN